MQSGETNGANLHLTSSLFWRPFGRREQDIQRGFESIQSLRRKHVDCRFKCINLAKARVGFTILRAELKNSRRLRLRWCDCQLQHRFIKAVDDGSLWFINEVLRLQKVRHR